MQPSLVLNAHRDHVAGKPVVFCIPDVKESGRFVVGCYRNNVNLILLIRRKWLPTTDLTACLAHIVVDDLGLDNLPSLLIALSRVKSAIPGLNDVHYFIAFSELNIDLLNDLADSFRGVRLTERRSRAFRDKSAMRELATREGIACPKFRLASELLADKDALDAFIVSVTQAAICKGNRPGYVLKPRDGWGARGVQLFRDRDALWQALRSLEAPEGYLVEEEIDGKLVHVDCAVIDRKVIYQGIGVYDSSLVGTDVSHQGHFMWHTMNPDTGLAKDLTRFNLRILEAFGLEYGFSHTEVFIENLTGDLVLCETACRPPGLRLLDLHAHAAGVHAYDRFVDLLAQPRNVPCAPPPSSRTVGTIIFNPHVGRLETMRPLAEIVDSHVIAWEQFAWPGEWFDDIHYTAELGQIVCVANGEIECVELLRQYKSRFNCTFSNAKGS